MPSVITFKIVKQVPLGPPDGGWAWVPSGETVEAENRDDAIKAGAGRLAMPAHMVRAIADPVEEIESVTIR